MKKTIIILFALISSVVAFSQKKDSVKQDTVFVLSPDDMNLITGILRSNSISIQGKSLTFDETLQLINYLYKKAQFVPAKTQPKK